MNIHYVSGSRADFGLMKSCLEMIDQHDLFELEIIVTGQHLLSEYGNTVSEIADSGFRISKEIPVELSGHDRHQMGIALAEELKGFLEHWQSSRPDLVMVLGDRGEMVAAALAAFHLGIPVGHLHGGERSASLDEVFRHVITKLSTWHFPATSDSAKRIRQLGESSDRIFQIGAPGLVDLSDFKPQTAAVVRGLKGSMEQPLAVVVYHPSVGEVKALGVKEVVQTLLDKGFCVAALLPNSDAGGAKVAIELSELSSEQVQLLTHLEREQYLNLVSYADLLVGNSSSGIIESASLGTACINLGERQRLRERNVNVVDCLDIDSLSDAINQAVDIQPPFENLYGDGCADSKLINALLRIKERPLDGIKIFEDVD